MGLVDALLEIAKESHCADLSLFRQLLQDAAEQQRSLIRGALDSKLVDESEFLRGVSHWLDIPWWNEPITTVAGPLR
ncbi:MAG: hypothetical protein JOY96_00405, partial [Verrucomicrobia bacterium]|nr:hypothetical protein [Verrucomicrobiota bacterium]